MKASGFAGGLTDNGSCFRGTVFQTACIGDDPLLRHVPHPREIPQTNGVVERFFRTIRPHQALNDRTPLQTYLNQTQPETCQFLDTRHPVSKLGMTPQ